jgi:hypothetical protein
VPNQNLFEPYEARCRRKDGKILWVEIHGKFQTYRGKRVRIVSLRDITERKQSEAQQFELAIEREKVMVLQRFIGICPDCGRRFRDQNQYLPRWNGSHTIRSSSNRI